mmetsp:Transcript_7579/g.13240  ORF Transcript_7579/g.13240 Transcript_7579/m.13240 type:complete len:155 (-) Transcript_7579:27-491(-)
MEVPGWLAKLRASREEKDHVGPRRHRAGSAEPRRLVDDVHGRMSKGVNVKALWRTVQELVGEDQPAFDNQSPDLESTSSMGRQDSDTDMTDADNSLVTVLSENVRRNAAASYERKRTLGTFEKSITKAPLSPAGVQRNSTDTKRVKLAKVTWPE